MADVPDLNIIKPRSKEALCGNECEDFEKCLKYPGRCSQMTEVQPRVYMLDDVITTSECKLLIDEVNKHQDLSFWCLGKDNDLDTKAFRNVQTIELFSETFASILWNRVREMIGESLFVDIFDEESEDYERELHGQWYPVDLNPDSLFAKYSSFGSFAPHTDGRAIIDFNHRSHYSVIIYLNSLPLDKGGGTRFYDKSAVDHLLKKSTGDNNNTESYYWTGDESLIQVEVEAVAGRMLIFHQSLVHEGVPPSASHEKYIIRSDIIFERRPAICDSITDREAYRLYRQAEELAEDNQVEESVKLFKKALKMSPEMAKIMGQG